MESIEGHIGFLDGGDGRIPVVAGPCSAESAEQCMATAKALASLGVRAFRAGLWKPRTKPGSFEGVGAKGLPWLADVKRETGMAVMTETATPAHVEAALRAGLDALWIGARTTTNPFAMQEIADALRGVQIPIFVKNPVTPDLALWVGAIERVENAGVKEVAAIHRGFADYTHSEYRNNGLYRWICDGRCPKFRFCAIRATSEAGARRSSHSAVRLSIWASTGCS